MTPRWLLPVAASSAISVISLIVAIVALSREPKCPSCDVAAPPPAPTRAGVEPPPPPPPESPVAPTPTPTPTAPTPTERSAKLVRMRHLVDELGYAVVALASTYPSLPDKVTAKTSIPWNLATGFTDAERMAKLIPWTREKIASGPSIPAIDAPAAAFLDHVDAWLSRWEAQQRYFARGDFLDDDLAEGRRADPDLRGSLARAMSLFVALSNAVDTEWRDEISAIAKRAPDSDRAAFERADQACRQAFRAATIGDLDKTALGEWTTQCRDSADELRARRIQEHEMSFIVDDLDAIATGAAELRRTGRGDRRSFAYHWIHASQLAVQVREDLSEVQAEATIPP